MESTNLFIHKQKYLKKSQEKLVLTDQIQLGGSMMKILFDKLGKLIELIPIYKSNLNKSDGHMAMLYKREHFPNKLDK